MPLAIDAGHSDKEGTSEECRKFKGRVVDLHWYQLFNRTGEGRSHKEASQDKFRKNRCIVN